MDPAAILVVNPDGGSLGIRHLGSCLGQCVQYGVVDSFMACVYGIIELEFFSLIASSIAIVGYAQKTESKKKRDPVSRISPFEIKSISRFYSS
jgi:hypothetical protein